jgi:hypothetical protein
MKRITLAAMLAALTVPAVARADDSALERSKALTAAPATERFAALASIPAATARVVADEVARGIPVPPGGTFSGVRWEQAGGVLSRTEIAAVLQYNASCQWLRAWRDHRETATSERVLADVPAWSAWRFAETGAVLAQVAADVRAGGGETAAAVLADCDASHGREVVYAAARGLPPSS